MSELDGSSRKDAKHETVDTEQASVTKEYSDFSLFGLTSYKNKKLMNQKQIIRIPEVIKYSGNPIIDTSELNWSPNVTYSFNTPSVLRVDHILDNPLGKYYMWYTGHDINGLGLAYSDDPQSGWTEHANNPIINGADITGADDFNETDVLWNPDDNAFYFYSSWGNWQMGLVTSPNGVDTFTEEGVIIESDFIGDLSLHHGYPRAFRTENGFYLYSWVGGGTGPYAKCSNSIYYSEDGKTDFKMIELANDLFTEKTDDVYYWTVRVNIIPWFNGYLMAWVEEDRTGVDFKSKIYAGFSPDGYRCHRDKIFIEPTQAWETGTEGGRTDAVEFLVDEEDIYVYWGNPDGKIGVGKLDLSEMIL